jgi:arabinofuranosyltransferase
MTADLRAWRGVDYALRTLIFDPATLPVVAAAVAATATLRRSDWPLAAGIVIYMAYVTTIGGDFMMGRFFVAPLVIAVALLSRLGLESRTLAVGSTAAILVLGLASPWEPALLSGHAYVSTMNRLRGVRSPEPSDQYRNVMVRSVVDERRRYAEFTGLLIMRRDGIVEHGWKYDGFRLRANGPRVVTRMFVGMTGFYAGPSVHIIDQLALADPLLARIPGGDRRSLMGHLTRALPLGYVETVESGRNLIVDRDLAEYYDALHEVVSGPLWSGRRLRVLAGFLLGRYEPYLAAYVARHKDDPAPEIVVK